MTTPLRGMADVMDAVIGDLRNQSDLVAHLEDKTAIYEAWPSEADRFDLQVCVSAVYEGSTNRGSGTRRTARVQIAVVSDPEWQQGRTNPETDMTAILDICADRLDRACAIPGVVPIGAGIGGGGDMTDLEHGRTGVLGDWRLQYTQIRDADPNDD